MDQKKFLNICGLVIFPILTLILFVFGIMLGKQILTVMGCVVLCTSLVLQFMAVKR